MASRLIEVRDDQPVSRPFLGRHDFMLGVELTNEIFDQLRTKACAIGLAARCDPASIVLDDQLELVSGLAANPHTSWALPIERMLDCVCNEFIDDDGDGCRSFRAGADF